MKLMSTPLLIITTVLAFAMPLDAQDRAASRDSISVVLDAFHAAASEADFDRYFGIFATDGVFIGTDATEHWTVDEFRAYVKPYFDAGRGWTYVPTARNIYLSPDGSTGWFDELLDNEGLGETRGSGVLVREDGEWKVAQYHLTIPVPNEIVAEVVEMIRKPAAQ
ncbi:MAG: protein with SnoaL 3 domain, NTF 2 superfamily [Gemmatimonas sp.]|nr:protein with SnoaL 3 domain, NTF 2 superfamily [Gemmatimonas sp.]